MKWEFYKVFLTVFFVFLLAQISFGQALNYYFGNIHAHTAYSDGNVENYPAYNCPAEDFAYAKKSLHFDFLGISEHNHLGAGMSLPRYANGLTEATLSNVDSSFVALYGMEWGTISQGGHVIIYGYDQLIGWETANYDVFNGKSNYDSLFTKIARYPGGNAFAYFAHPDATDYDSLFKKPLNLTSDSAIVGTAIYSGPAFSTDTTYSNPSTFSYEVRYKEALSLGYHLGAGLDHDNHYTTFGRTAQSRMVILAPSLTKNNVISAIKNMRMYASQDWNAKVNFTINGQVLGSIYTGIGTPTLSVSVADDDGESVSFIDVYSGVPGSGVLATKLTTATNSTTLTFTHNIANLSSYYYYLVITQPDGNKIITSPIWYTRNDAVVLPVSLTSFVAEQNAQQVSLKWKTVSETNNAYFVLESSLNGFDFDSIGNIKGAGTSAEQLHYNFIDSITPNKLKSGIIYYRLKQVDYNKNINYSTIIKVNYKYTGLFTNIVVFPVPTSAGVNLSFYAKEDTQMRLVLYNMTGGVIYDKVITALTGENKIYLDLSSETTETFFLKGFDENSSSLFSKTIICNH